MRTGQIEPGGLVVDSRVPALDILRGLAASLIFVYHFFAISPFAPDCVAPTLRHIVLSFFGMGVPLFFALSGTSLYIGFFPRRHRPEFLSDFYYRRFFRIAPLFYFAAGVWVAIFHSRGAPIDGGRLFATATFLFNLIPGWHESYVGAGWSVGIEMLFYGIFPIFLVLAQDLLSSVFSWCLAVALSVVGYSALTQLSPAQNYPSLAFISHLGYFATGVLVYFCIRRTNTARLRTWRIQIENAGLLLALILIVYFLAGGLWTLVHISPPQSIARMFWAVPIGILIALACRLPADGRLLAPFVALGSWSYSVYLLHPIVLYFVFDYVRTFGHIEVPSAFRFTVVLVASFVVLVGSSFLSFRYIEQPFIRWGKMWCRRATARLAD